MGRLAAAVRPPYKPARAVRLSEALGVSWLARLRVRVLALVIGGVLAALGVLSLTTFPAWGVWGVTVAAVAMAVHRVANKLSEPTCLGCGENIAKVPQGEHGAVCPHCGTICPRPGHTRSA